MSAASRAETELNLQARATEPAPKRARGALCDGRSEELVRACGHDPRIDHRWDTRGRGADAQARQVNDGRRVRAVALTARRPTAVVLHAEWFGTLSRGGMPRTVLRVGNVPLKVLRHRCRQSRRPMHAYRKLEYENGGDQKACLAALHKRELTPAFRSRKGAL